MSKGTIGVGVALILIGAIGYFASGMASWTALIPAIFGVIFVVLGVLALNPLRRKLAMHIAVVIALLGAIGPAMRMRKSLGAEDFKFDMGFGSQALTALICAAFFLACLWSFIAARRGPKIG